MEVTPDEMRVALQKAAHRIGTQEARIIFLETRIETLTKRVAELEEGDDEPDSRGTEATPAVPDGAPS